MISFKQFVIEAQRDPDRAVRLGKYLAKRATQHIVEPEFPGKEVLLSKKFDRKANPNEEYRDHPAINAYEKLHNKHKTKNLFDSFPDFVTHQKDFPHSALHHLQATVAFDSDYFSNNKLHDKRPINVIKHDGKHYVVDGHHRWFRDRILGSKTSHAKIFDMDKFHEIDK